VPGPALAESYIQQTTKVSSEITLLNQHGSHVLLGNILLVPIDQSMLYVRPLYVESSGNPQPQLKDVIGVLGQKVAMTSTLDGTLTNVTGIEIGASSRQTTTSTATKTQPTKKPSTSALGSTAVTTARNDLKSAAQQYTKAQAALKAGTLGAYQTAISAMNQDLASAQAVLGGVTVGTAPSSTSPSPTTTTTAPAHSGSKSTSKKDEHSTTSTSAASTSARSPASGGSTTTTTAAASET
jgi:uncharacterized protein